MPTCKICNVLLSASNAHSAQSHICTQCARFRAASGSQTWGSPPMRALRDVLNNGCELCGKKIELGDHWEHDTPEGKTVYLCSDLCFGIFSAGETTDEEYLRKTFGLKPDAEIKVEVPDACPMCEHRAHVPLDLGDAGERVGCSAILKHGVVCGCSGEDKRFSFDDFPHVEKLPQPDQVWAMQPPGVVGKGDLNITISATTGDATSKLRSIMDESLRAKWSKR